MKESKEKLKQL